VRENLTVYQIKRGAIMNKSELLKEALECVLSTINQTDTTEIKSDVYNAIALLELFLTTLEGE